MIRTLLALAFGCSLTVAQAAEKLTQLDFGIISTESSQNLKQDFEPLRGDMEAAIGMPVKLFFASDYAGVIEAMRFNKVQLGWFGNKSAIDAVDRAGGEVICQCIDKDGNPGYWSLIVVHKDSPINTLEELFAKSKELTFSNGDPQSTSGFLVPGYYAFAKNNVDVKTAFKATRNGNHEANALAVANKQVDAATFNTEAMFKLEARNPEAAKNLKAIWKSPLIASDPMVVKADLEPELKQKVTTFFTGYGKTDEQKAKIAAMKWSGFKPSNNNQLLPYRLLNLLKDKAKLKGDDKFTAADKTAKLAEFDTKIADINAQIAKAGPAQ